MNIPGANSWNPALYLKFGAERTRPAADLLARAPLEAPQRIVDLGCGPGNSTALLRARYPGADIIGLDSSQAMLDQAAASGLDARWVLGDLDAWAPDAPVDLIYANAAFHWSADIFALIGRLMDHLAPGGALAYQVPFNLDQPCYTEVRAAAALPRWRAALAQAPDYKLGAPEDHARALAPRAGHLDIWTSRYLHILEGPDAAYRWSESTGVRPFLDALPEAERADFSAELKTRFARFYPQEPDGRTLFPFRRLFVVAIRRA